MIDNIELRTSGESDYNKGLLRAAWIASTWHDGNPVEVEICDLIAKAILGEKVKK